MNHSQLYSNFFCQHKKSIFRLCVLLNKNQLNYINLLLLRVFRSQTFIEPLFDPTIIWSSACVKVSAVIDETFEVLLLSAVIGFILSILYSNRLFS